MSVSKHVFKTSTGADVAILKSGTAGSGVVFLGGLGAAHDLFDKGRDLAARADKEGLAFASINWQTPENGLVTEWRQNLLEAFSHIAGEKPQVVVGSSFGAWLAVLLAQDVEAKKLIKGLVCINPAFDGLHIAERSLGEKGLAFLNASHTNQFPLQTPTMQKPFHLKQAHLTDAREHLILSGEKARIADVPALLFHGVDDKMAPLMLSEAFLARAKPGTVELRRMQGGHDMGGVEFMDQLWAGVTDMLKRPSSPTNGPAGPKSHTGP